MIYFCKSTQDCAFDRQQATKTDRRRQNGRLAAAGFGGVREEVAVGEKNPLVAEQREMRRGGKERKCILYLAG